MNSDPSPIFRRPSAPLGSVPPQLAARKRSLRLGRVLFGLALALVMLFVWSQLRPSQPPEVPFRNPEPPRAPAPIVVGQEPPREQPRTVTRTVPKPAKPEKITGPRSVPPDVSVPGGIQSDSITVTLSSKSPAAKIHFTMDGSEPTEGSRLYDEPLTVDKTTLLKAKSFEPGLAPSVTVAHTYTMVDSGFAGFTSNLPLVIVNTFGQRVSKEQPILASLRVVEPAPKRSAITGPAGYDGQCEIKLRGYSSLRFPKNSFTLKTKNGAGESASASLLGMPSDSDWVLYAPYSDKTLMRDVLAYELSNKMGRYAARTRFVEVFFIRHAGKLSKRDYVGVYVLEEKIKRGPDRVNIQKLTPEDNSEPNISGGYIFKRDHTSPPGDSPQAFFGQNGFGDGERGFRTTRGIQLFYVDPKEIELLPAQRTWLSRYLNQFEKALYGPNFKSPTEGYARYLDVDSFIDQFWIVELSKNVDGFRYSCYMTKDRNGKIRMEPIWDWNLSFGNANYHQGWMPDRWYWRLLRENEIAWYRRLRQDPEFMRRLVDRWVELRKDVLAPETILNRIDEMAAQLTEAQKRNFQRWPILGQSVNPNWYVGSSFQDEVDWMKNWIQERIAWIDRQVGQANFVPDDGENP